MKKIALFIVLFVVFQYSCCFAIESVSIEPNTQSISLGKRTVHLFSEENFTQIRSNQYKNKFKPVTEDALNYGFNSDACWIHFVLNNKSDINENFILEIKYGLLDYLNIYYFETNSPENVTEIKTGDMLPMESRPIKHRKFVSPLKIKNEIQVYVQVKTAGVLTVPMTLWTPNSFFEFDRKSNTIYAMYYGMIIVMIFYNLFISFTTKDRDYLIYVFHIVAIMFTQLGLNGFASEIWPNWPSWTNQSLAFFLGCYFFSLLLFTQSFLKLKDFFPRFNKVLNVLLVLLGILTIISLNVPYVKVIKIYGLIGLTLPILVFILPLLIVSRYKPAWYFSAATLILLVGTLTVALMNFGVLPNNVFTNNAAQAGFAVEIIILSLGLASKINLMKKEIEVQNIELTRLGELKDNFLSNTTHELKTPLHGIMGIAEALKDGSQGDLNQNVKSSLSIVINSARRLSVLVNDILDVQRLRYKDIDLHIKTFDLNQVVNVICSVSQPLLKNKPVELINKIIPDSIYVKADSNRLYQIIQNLVGNSCKFTDSGTIELTAKEKNNLVYISIFDTGHGIPLEDQSKIFEPFEQASSLPSGTGLGLSISKKIVELHGGTIEVQSAVGEGTQFIFTIPAGIKTDQSLLELQLPKNITYVEDEEYIKAKMDVSPDKHILVVDDEPINRKVVTDILTMDQFNVHECASGKETLEYLETNMPDLILLDVMMPEIDGFTVCEKVRERFNQFELPIIFITAKNQVTDLVQGFSLGGNDYLTKPFSKNELLSRVRCQLSISTAKERLTSLREFANKICLFKNVDVLAKEVYNYVVNDPKVESAAIFQNDKLVRCTHPNKEECKEIFNLWKHTGEASDDLLFLSLKEIKDFVLIIKAQFDKSPIDREYFKNLEAQANIIVKNYQRLVSDTYFLEDMYTIARHKKDIRFIKSENRQSALYGSEEYEKIYLKSSLNTIECFFNKNLIRVNRFCLINPKKIQQIEKIPGTRNKKDSYLVNVDGKKIEVPHTHINNLPEKFRPVVVQRQTA